MATGEDLLVHLVAHEESGDALGAALMRALRTRNGERVRFGGAGGRQMAAEGLNSPLPVDSTAIIGFSAIVRHLFALLRRIRETADVVIAARPDVLVIIDSPDFTHRVARRVRAAIPLLPIVDYVSPSVWAWRPGRAAAMRAYVDHVLALLPFEPDVHRQLGGPACTYVGHPLVERIAVLRPDAVEAERRMRNPPLLLVLPGSRTNEVRRLSAVFGETVEKVAAQVGEIELVLPTVPAMLPRVRQETARWPLRPRIVVEADEKWAAFRSARAALAASGTVTLELALAGVPTIAAYKVAAMEAVVARRVIKAPSVILANLVLGENVVPEFLQENCTPDNLAAALAPLLSDTPQRQRQLDAFASLDAIMEIGTAAPSARAADIVLDIAGRAKTAS